MDPELWKVENYLDFLAERRRLLAASANEFLEKLLSGGVPETPAAADTAVAAHAPAKAVPGDIESDEEEALLPVAVDGLELVGADRDRLARGPGTGRLRRGRRRRRRRGHRRHGNGRLLEAAQHLPGEIVHRVGELLGARDLGVERPSETVSRRRIAQSRVDAEPADLGAPGPWLDWATGALFEDNARRLYRLD